jgi:probable selenium-dependent hydroxylase accessory protein YqeC
VVVRRHGAWEGDTSGAARDIELSVGAGRSAPLSAVVGVVMAAGSARRFGGNKLLKPFRGKPLLRWVIEAALRSRLACVNVILGHQHGRIRAALADFDGAGRLTFTINERHANGQSESIIAGLSTVSADSAGAMFLVGDQPLLDARTIDRLIAAFEASPAGICYPRCDGQRRNPVIFARRFFADLRRLRGDVGGSVVIADHPEVAVPVTFDDPKPFCDVDRRADINLLASDGADASEPAAAMTLTRALGLETSRVISLCGSGGKTGLMAALVREFAARDGERILATTTTKMGIDEVDGPWRACRAAEAAEAADAADLLAAIDIQTPAVLVYRAVDAQRGRLLGLPAEMVDALAKLDRFTRILVEADGSRRRPLKAPGPREPVFPASTDVVVMVAGLSGLGLPLGDDAVFRADNWVALTGCQRSERVTADALARVISHPNGLARGAPAQARHVLFLNQADAVLHALSTLGGQCPERSVVGQLQPQARVCAVRVHAARELQNSGERR